METITWSLDKDKMGESIPFETLPPGKAPEISLTNEEVVAWNDEFQGQVVNDSFETDSMWVPF